MSCQDLIMQSAGIEARSSWDTDVRFVWPRKKTKSQNRCVHFLPSPITDKIGIVGGIGLTLRHFQPGSVMQMRGSRTWGEHRCCFLCEVHFCWVTCLCCSVLAMGQGYKSSHIWCRDADAYHLTLGGFRRSGGSHGCMGYPRRAQAFNAGPEVLFRYR